MSEHQSVARAGADQYGDQYGGLNARGRGVASRGRRGSAIFVVMMLTIALAALAGSAVLLTSGAHLVLNYHNQERDLRYGAEAALADGASDLNNNPYTLPDTGYVQITSNATLKAADGATVPGVVYDLYAGPTGSASKQKGRFVTLVAIAKDTARHRQFVRREELNQTSFAKYAYFSVNENGICFGSGDRLGGPVFSDDNITTCAAPQKADFMDSVWTPSFSNGDPAVDTLYKGWKPPLKPLALPSTAKLASLYAIAAGSNTEFFTPNVATDSTAQILSRLEYVAYDLNADADSSDPGEGFVKFYQVDLAKPLVVKPVGAWTAAQKDSVGVGYLRSGITRQHDANNCGEWREVYNDAGVPEWEFFTIAAHHTAFYRYMVSHSTGPAFPLAVSNANANTTAGSPSQDDTIPVDTLAHNLLRNGDPSHPPRCYPGGDPHLVYAERDTTAGAPNRAGFWQNPPYSQAGWKYGYRGGTDTTFTGGDVSDPGHPSRMGHWLPWPGAAPGTFTAAFKASHPDWKYLYPTDKTYNATFKGVVAVHGSVAVSGNVNGRITMYSDGSVGIVDNLRLTNDADTSCNHLMGIVAGVDILAMDNGVNAPAGDSGVRIQMRNGSSDLWVESTVMALSSWGAEGLVVDPGATFVALQQPCQGTGYARGCLHVQGSIIQQTRHTVNGPNAGYSKRYNYDNCAVVNPLPYFPTTGQLTVNNYYESDPVHFSVAALFAALAP